MTRASRVYRILALLRTGRRTACFLPRPGPGFYFKISELSRDDWLNGANNMYAVFRTGGKQYRAEKGDVLRLEKIDADEGETLEFDDVLLVGEGSDIEVGSPTLANSAVSAKVLRQGKSRKVPVVKFRRRQNYLKQGTHRQFFTEVEITGIKGASGEKAEAKDSSKTDAGTTAKKKTASKKKTAKKAAAKKKTAKKAASKKKAAKKTAKKKSS